VLLAVDVGNTNTVLGLFDGEHLFESYRIKTDPRATADELALTFRGLLPTTRARTASPSARPCPAVLHELRTMFERYFADVPTVVVGPGTRTGVPLLYDNPARGRARPHRQHAGRAHPVRRSGRRRRLRHLHELRRGERCR
jgi:type III pantothenate kinase